MRGMFEKKVFVGLILCMALVLGVLPSGDAAQAVSKVKKQGNGYYATAGWTGYRYYKKQLYKFDANHFMSLTSFQKAKKAIQSKSYKKLKKAIGGGKRINRYASCNGGKYDYIYQFGNCKVYTTDDKITYIAKS